MWLEQWGTMIWGTSAVPALNTVGLMLLMGAILGVFALYRRPLVNVSAALLILAVVSVPIVIWAVTLPHTFTNGTVADADEVNANFNALSNKVGQEIFRGYLTSGASTSIVTNDGGQADFDTEVNSDPSVIEVVSGGLQFNQAGMITWQYHQDFIATGTGFVYISAVPLGQTPVNTLASPSGGLWDGLSNGGVAQVTAGDTLLFNVASTAGADITGFEGGTALWSHLMVVWMP